VDLSLRGGTRDLGELGLFNDDTPHHDAAMRMPWHKSKSVQLELARLDPEPDGLPSIADAPSIPCDASSASELNEAPIPLAGDRPGRTAQVAIAVREVPVTASLLLVRATPILFRATMPQPNSKPGRSISATEMIGIRAADRMGAAAGTNAPTARHRQVITQAPAASVDWTIPIGLCGNFRPTTADRSLSPATVQKSVEKSHCERRITALMRGS
jgi:hypothetical protein